jgi:hypothetical protein
MVDKEIETVIEKETADFLLDTAFVDFYVIACLHPQVHHSFHQNVFANTFFSIDREKGTYTMYE